MAKEKKRERKSSADLISGSIPDISPFWKRLINSRFIMSHMKKRKLSKTEGGGTRIEMTGGDWWYNSLCAVNEMLLGSFFAVSHRLGKKPKTNCCTKNGAAFYARKTSGEVVTAAFVCRCYSLTAVCVERCRVLLPFFCLFFFQEILWRGLTGGVS